MIIGYARVSSTEQETALQTDALRRANVDRIYEEKRSAVKKRPALAAALCALKPGDILVVYKTDRLARSLSDLLRIIEQIRRYGASFKSLSEPFDTSSLAGNAMLQILGVFAEFERGMIRERSIAGQEAARRRGSRIGRPRALSEHQQAEVYRLLRRGKTKSEVARMFDVHLSTVKRVWLRIERPDSPAVAKKA